MRPRFLLDEHVNPAIERQLQRYSRELDVVRVGGLGGPEKGTLDDDLLLWAEERHFILVSEDRSTLPDCLASHLESGHHSYGILWIRPGASLGRVIDELFLIWQVCAEDEFLDMGLFIPL